MAHPDTPETPTQEAAQPRASASEITGPPSVSRGTKSHANGPIVDWVSMTGPRHLLPKIMDLLANYFGELTEGSVGGKYRRAYRIGDASGVMYDGGPKNLRDRLKVQLTGAILGEMEPQAIRQDRKSVV